MRAVADLHQIVDLRAAADVSFAHAGAVDAGVGLDLDVVFNHHRLGLRNLVPASSVVLGEAEAVGADDHAILQKHIISQAAALADDRMGVGKEVVTDLRPAIDDHMGQQHRILADLDVFADHHVRSNVRARADARRRMHHGRRMHSRRIFRRLME